MPRKYSQDERVAREYMTPKYMAEAWRDLSDWNVSLRTWQNYTRSAVLSGHLLYNRQTEKYVFSPKIFDQLEMIKMIDLLFIGSHSHGTLKRFVNGIDSKDPDIFLDTPFVIADFLRELIKRSDFWNVYQFLKLWDEHPDYMWTMWQSKWNTLSSQEQEVIRNLIAEQR